MKIIRDTVIKWLTEKNKSQSWLAEKCRVSDQAVSNWLRENNYRPISATAQITIRKLMDEDTAAAQATPPHTLVLEFNSKQYAPIEQAALQNHETVREWAKRTLNDATEADMKTVVEKRNGTHSKNSS
jgi:hypothetical protein